MELISQNKTLGQTSLCIGTDEVPGCFLKLRHMINPSEIKTRPAISTKLLCSRKHMKYLTGVELKSGGAVFSEMWTPSSQESKRLFGYLSEDSLS